jgi:hypothetical protein
VRKERLLPRSYADLAGYQTIDSDGTDQPLDGGHRLDLDDSDWRFGQPQGDSYASPWYVLTIKHDDIVNPQGSLTDAVTDEIAKNAAEYLGFLR